jgi:hypothetical protein
MRFKVFSVNSQPTIFADRYATLSKLLDNTLCLLYEMLFAFRCALILRMLTTSPDQLRTGKVSLVVDAIEKRYLLPVMIG